jgi:molybdenum cofactor biosynthesis protein B
MVDFQSRDTKRSMDEDGDDGDESTAKPGDDPADDVETAPPEDETAQTADSAASRRQAETVTEDYDQDAVTYAVVTVAADRTLSEDPTGDAIVDAITYSDDAVVTRELLEPSYDGVQSAIDSLVDREDVSAVVTTGGTGVEPADVTVDTAEDLFEKHLPGFGELFRVLSHEQEGTAIVRTRTTAGIIDGAPVFCLPGDTTAARRGVEQIVLAEAETLVRQASE